MRIALHAALMRFHQQRQEVDRRLGEETSLGSRI